MMDHLSSCGAKRARIALPGETPALPSSSCTRDWASLGADGPGGLIAELALASDVADYVRFRAVCRPWRRWSPDPRAGCLDGRFLPRRWIMLAEAVPGRRCRRHFLNVTTGECIRMDLPELAEHTLLAPTPEGLLLLLHEATQVVRLLNPLTRQLIDLPPITALMTPEQLRFRRLDHSFGVDLVNGVGIVADGDSSMVVVRFTFPTLLAVAKPGDETWTEVDGTLHDVDDPNIATLPFAGRFYCATSRGVMVLDTSGSDQRPELLRTAVDRSRSSLIDFNLLAHSLHLVDNGGELMLVQRTRRLNVDPGDNRYEVCRVDLDAGTLIPVKSFNGRAVFMGMRRSISVAAEALPTVAADFLYLGTDCDEKIMMLDGYNVADGSNVPLHNEWREHPWTLVDCLSSCIHGSGELLA